jgi:pimeloyl-ACP methyl ester carboxylesterase
MESGREIRLDSRQGRLAGLHWKGAPGAPRVLCLHGWLDNAASFLPLAPLLNGLECIAIDLPGHGHSGHRHSTARYHFIDYLWDVDAALDALGWNDCHFLGHSMGAAISSVYAAGAPDRVRSAVLLDTLGPISSAPDTTTNRLRRSLAKSRRDAGKPRLYGSVAEMVEARRSVSGQSLRSAQLICDRAARRDGDGFVWRSDPALNWVSSLVMTEDQAHDLLANIEAPVLSFIATREAPWASRETVESRKRTIAHGRHEAIDGGHHFHMDDPGKIAGTIRKFILANDRPNKGEQETDEQ